MSSEDHHGNGVRDTSIAGIIVIFFLGLAGSLVPPLITKHKPDFDINRSIIFRFFTGFAAGIVLSVGYIHSLPDAAGSFAEAAGDSEKGYDVYAWFGFVAMIGGLMCFYIEQLIHRRIAVKYGLEGHSHGEHSPKHDHDHKLGESSVALEAGGADAKYEASEVNRVNYFTELWVLFFGLAFHSTFVGLALGLEPDNWGLFAAIVFHQFFEGLALGARVARAAFKKDLHFWLLDIGYALTVPVGIAIGMGIYASVVEGSRTYAIVNGVFQALSGGILIYVSTVHMMKEEMERPEFKGPGSRNLLAALFVGFLLGAAALAIVGIWA